GSAATEPRINVPNSAGGTQRRYGRLRVASGGREGIRTLDLSVANAALSQLSYAPTSAPSVGFEYSMSPGHREIGLGKWREIRDARKIRRTRSGISQRSPQTARCA